MVFHKVYVNLIYTYRLHFLTEVLYLKQKKIIRIIAIVIAVALAVSLLMLPMAGMAFAA